MSNTQATALYHETRTMAHEIRMASSEVPRPSLAKVIHDCVTKDYKKLSK
jgi:hypothetical protein